MDDRNTISVVDHANLQGLAVGSRADEHRDVGVIGLEASPVVSKCMEHVVVGDTVRASARLDVRPVRLRTAQRTSTHVDAPRLNLQWSPTRAAPLAWPARPPPDDSVWVDRERLALAPDVR